MFPKNKPKPRQERGNSTGTFKWIEKTSTNKRQRSMRESLVKIKKTLASYGSVNLYQAVSLPNKPEIEADDSNTESNEVCEWFAENTVDFYNEIYVIFSFVTEENKTWSDICENPSLYANKGYPDRVKYLWRANAAAKPKELPVDVYVEHIFMWIDALIDNEEIFPTEEDVPFPPEFKKHILKIYQRLFRVFAIIFSNECLYSGVKVEQKQLKTSLKHFMYFCWRWNLLSDKEWKCIENVVGPMKEEYQKDMEDFLLKKHTKKTSGFSDVTIEA